jgi:hypothetical protein
MFDAFEKRRGRRDRNCPCTATKVSAARVEAIDSRGLDRIFSCHVWRFEEVNDGD